MTPVIDLDWNNEAVYFNLFVEGLIFLLDFESSLTPGAVCCERLPLISFLQLLEAPADASTHA